MVSQDGRSVYVAAWNYNGDKTAVNGSLAVFRRNTDTGALTFAQCFSTNGASGNVAGRCSVGRGMTGARDVTISPDQRTVYAGPNGTIATYNRDLTDTATRGNLTQLGGTAGCITSTNVVGCFDSAAIGREGRQFSVSPDGENVDAVGATAPASLVILNRNTGGGLNHGALSQEPGTQSCFGATNLGGECTVMARLAGASAALTSPDGHETSTSRRARARSSSRATRPARSRSAAASTTPGRAGAAPGKNVNGLTYLSLSPDQEDLVGSIETAPKGLVMLARDGGSGGRPEPAHVQQRGLRVDERGRFRRRRRHDHDLRRLHHQRRARG